ncbi:hypothetical protein QCA50_001741 [Cerrena zonata]|uniref:RNA-dependent RNA polymerase n=1 Tax=Cerrena zonata TaxID=2478898 RepID=A0AAW0GXN1_9APHY
MEVFIENIPSQTTLNQVKAAIAKVVHGPAYRRHSSSPLNLHVFLFPQTRNNGTRYGVVTFPSAAIANQFLNTHGPSRTEHIFLGRRIIFKPSTKVARPEIVQEIRMTPYVDPEALEKQERRTAELLSRRVKIVRIQFGWECRDRVFSAEWEAHREDAVLGDISYHDARREFRISLDGFDRTHMAVIHAAKITWAASSTNDDKPLAFLSLNTPPSFESSEPRPTSDSIDDLSEGMATMSITSPQKGTSKRLRHPHLHPSQAVTAPYTSLAIRITCHSEDDLETFNTLCREAHTRLEHWVYPAEYRRLFTRQVQSSFTGWLLTFSWKVAFQLEAIVRSLLVDPKELLTCRNRIERMVSDKGEAYLITFLRYLVTQINIRNSNEVDDDDDDDDDDNGQTPQSLKELFARCADDFTLPSKTTLRPIAIDPDNLFDCLHVIVTPTRIRLEGPYPERSNRVMRLYPHNHDSFIRVSFAEESKLQFRVDHDVDGREFIKKRFGDILRNGLEIGGYLFRFLAYSQSALKEHAVWFVKDFVTPEGISVTAASIIAGLGDFTKPDPQLMRCPARYAARISQAFTATDASATVQAEEIFIEEDMLDPSETYNFTDGVGTISRNMAIAIWSELRKKRKKVKRNATYPRAFQIRFQGSKGMLSIDHTLTGKVIVLRPSMIKFEAPDANIIEIARAFDRPGPFFLNRPLIMILEHLGVQYETFETLQDTAVQGAKNSVESLGRTARLLETYGLGASYKLTSIMLNLEKLGVDAPLDDHFYQHMMDFAVNHVLRELKYHARIPVKDAWNLVGVADVHGYLKEREVFVHIVPVDGQQPFYFKGKLLITRSPTIHPGDVQVVRAIGRPPPGSPFEKETLRNCVVFSTKGSRPLPTYLGGGDLDGDVYCVTGLPDLMPTKMYTPAAYTPAERSLLDRNSTMDDVADFVTEYLYSDSLGLIATQWLIIADQASILDPDCLLLSQLHSDAVDYPKTGRPVPLDSIPRLKMRVKPDWSAPETSASRDRAKYYQSKKAIGRLFRAIDLPAVHSIQDAQHDQQSRLQPGKLTDIEDIIDNFHAANPFEDDEVTVAVYERVTDIIAVGRHDDDIIGELWDLFQQYSYHMHSVCVDHTVSNAMLTEEEVIIGTIVAKCSQPRRRKDLMSAMRERTALLAQDIALQIEGDEGTLMEKSLERAWVAFRIANLERDTFGARSFGWIALGEIFDGIKKIEESEGYL